MSVLVWVCHSGKSGRSKFLKLCKHTGKTESIYPLTEILWGFRTAPKWKNTEVTELGSPWRVWCPYSTSFWSWTRWAGERKELEGVADVNEEFRAMLCNFKDCGLETISQSRASGAIRRRDLLSITRASNTWIYLWHYRNVIHFRTNCFSFKCNALVLRCRIIIA